jgi:hypothetical protein
MTEAYRTIPVSRRTRDLLAQVEKRTALGYGIGSEIRWEIRELVDQWDQAAASEVVVEEQEAS